jgi:hypothetical protein
MPPRYQRRPILLWRSAEAKNRLLPGASILMPETWRRWEEPTPPLAIDAEISRLVHRQRRPRLVTRARLERSGIPCPYWYAREGTYTAAEIAMLVASRAQQAGPQRHSELAQITRRLTNAQHAVAEVQLAWNGSHESLDSPRVADSLGKIQTELAAIKAHLGTRYVSREANVGEAWKTSFAQSLALTWENLTGSEPRGGREFLGFIKAAWASLGDGMPSTSWSHAAQSAIRLHRGQ